MPVSSGLVKRSPFTYSGLATFWPETAEPHSRQCSLAPTNKPRIAAAYLQQCGKAGHGTVASDRASVTASLGVSTTTPAVNAIWEEQAQVSEARAALEKTKR